MSGSTKIDSTEEEQALISKLLLSPQMALAVFLPKGYPETVTPNYWQFAKWQFLHNVTGSVSAVISTQSLLFAMGLGAGSIPMAAALNWIIKDGLGQLGGVVYASFVSDKFDSEPKRYRFQATVAMQGANILELLTPLWPGYFLIIASISNIGKNMAWLASSATRAQMNKTFALRDNLGDITGKSGSQATAAGLVGTGLGVIIAALMSHVSEDPAVLPLVPMCLTFMPFAFLNIYSNYRSSHYVTTSSLNVSRIETVFHNILKEMDLGRSDTSSSSSNSSRISISNSINGSGSGSGSGSDISKEKQLSSQLQERLERLIPTPKHVAHEEVFVGPYHSPFKIGVEIEPIISRYAGQGERAWALGQALRQAHFVRTERYYMMADATESNKVVIWFDKKAQNSDLVQGFYHACAARKILERRRGDGPEVWEEAVRAAHEEAIASVATVSEVMSGKGWDMSSLFLTDGDRNRIQLDSLSSV
ncbi:hypothetical protein BGZ99_003051 [Dissophora globulifera]|uniref:Protein root UVB sensitive/RUS domain-containing protein n=1 Tax=Dissophora globulifera TaxID=979702 RepID=A0A9P6RVK8_9FUNG|nr:hypothetical protein BGZ99_003051 [Dissophora globulifera]